MINKLQGTLAYVQVQTPVKCYEESKGFEYKASIIITDEDTADEFDALYPKQAAKKIKTAEFESIFKCPPPEGAGKNVWQITLRKNTKLSNGDDVPEKYRPKVFTKNADGTLNDVTASILPANGSQGFISIDHYESKYGNVARLKNVLVTEMIEYTGSESAESGSEFGDAPAPAAKSAPKATPKTSKAKAAEATEENPF